MDSLDSKIGLMWNVIVMLWYSSWGRLNLTMSHIISEWWKRGTFTGLLAHLEPMRKPPDTVHWLLSERWEIQWAVESPIFHQLLFPLPLSFPPNGNHTPFLTGSPWKGQNLCIVWYFVWPCPSAPLTSTHRLLSIIPNASQYCGAAHPLFPNK